MATIKEVILSQCADFGFEVSEITLDAHFVKTGGVSSDVYSADNAKVADKVMYSIIPLLLLMPEVSEGQFSKKYNVAGITTYYKSLCIDLNLPDKLNPQPKIVNKSNIW